MQTIYTTAQDALAAPEAGARHMRTLDAACDLVGEPAITLSGRAGCYGLPVYQPAHVGGDDVVGVVHVPEAWICHPVMPELDGMDLHGRPMRDGLLQDLAAHRAALAR